MYVCEAFWLLVTECIVMNKSDMVPAFLSLIIKWQMIGYLCQEALSPDTFPCTVTEFQEPI